MRIDIMTLFPETLGDVLSESILGRAQERGFIRIEAHQIRAYTANKQNQTDDYPYGGGRGAVMTADPLYRCWEAICDEAGGPVHTIYMSPCGHTFKQADAIRLSRMENIILVCGHYEGIDTMEAAQAMRGRVVELYREDIDDEVIFAAELIGVEVYAAGENIGKIVEVLDYPGNSVYVVKGKYEYMIPAVKAFILNTDMEANRMEVRLLEGMRSDEN